MQTQDILRGKEGARGLTHRSNGLEFCNGPREAVSRANFSLVIRGNGSASLAHEIVESRTGGLDLHRAVIFRHNWNNKVTLLTGSKPCLFSAAAGGPFGVGFATSRQSNHL